MSGSRKTISKGGQSEPKAVSAIPSVLGLQVANRAALIDKIRQGFPIDAFDHLAKVMGLKDKELCDATIIPVRTLTRRKKTGHFQADESDRLVRLATLFDQSVELFEGDRDLAADWFRTSKKALGGASPLEYANNEIGVQEVRDLIGRLEHGVFG